MKRLSLLLRVVLLLLTFVFGCSGGSGSGGNDDSFAPLMGILQFRIRHNVQVFRNDYDPIGLWAERQGVLPENLYNVNNIFPCMGLYDDNGQPKPGITDLWLDALP